MQPRESGRLSADGTGRRHQRHSLGEWLLVGLVLAYAGLLLVAPIAAMLHGALRPGLGAFWNEVSSPDALNALKLTIVLGLGATFINVAFGLAIAWVLVRDDFRGRKLVNGLVDLPFAVSPVIAGLMLILLFGREGWFASLTDALGLRVLFAWPSMLLATLFVSLPFVIREVMPVLTQIGIQQELAAYTMGASPWRTFWCVTFPSLRWGLLYGISLTLARALGEFGAVLMVSGGMRGLTETSTLYIFRCLDDRNYGGAYSMALVLAVISFSLLMGMEVLKKRTEQRR